MEVVYKRECSLQSAAFSRLCSRLRQRSLPFVANLIFRMSHPICCHSLPFANHEIKSGNELQFFCCFIIIYQSRILIYLLTAVVNSSFMSKNKRSGDLSVL